VFGSVPNDHALRRDGAHANDDVWVSGSLGEARLGLEVLTGHLKLSADDTAVALQRLHRPIPRVSLGLALRGIASAAIDISDGLTGDLGHILERSALGATIEADLLPIGSALRSQDQKIQYEFALNGGDDYELCFCAPPAQRDRVIAAAQQVGVAVTRIGQTTEIPGLRVLDRAGKNLHLRSQSFDHFSTP
jgi:thiamine-monophosphate kinase